MLAAFVASDAWLKGHTDEAGVYHVDVSLKIATANPTERAPS